MKKKKRVVKKGDYITFVKDLPAHGQHTLRDTLGITNGDRALVIDPGKPYYYGGIVFRDMLVKLSWGEVKVTVLRDYYVIDGDESLDPDSI